MTPPGWDAPTVYRLYGKPCDVSVLEDGRQVVAVEAHPCLEPWGDAAVCGLVRNHTGNHWMCARELAEDGPFAIVKPDPTLTNKENA